MRFFLGFGAVEIWVAGVWASEVIKPTGRIQIVISDNYSRVVYEDDLQLRCLERWAYKSLKIRGVRMFWHIGLLQKS